MMLAERGIHGEHEITKPLELIQVINPVALRIPVK